MGREVIMQYFYSLKHKLAGGLLCCCVLLAAYLCQLLFSELYMDAFSSSIYLAGWMTLLVGALLWTLREKDTHGLPTEIIEWQCVAAFLLVVGDQVYVMMPKEIHIALDPVLSTYTMPALVIGGLVITALIQFSASLHLRLANERRQAALQAQRLQELLASPIPEQKEHLLVRKLLENASIAQFTNEEFLLLVEGCRMLDPVFFSWLQKHDLKLPPRDIILCVLIRLRKSKDELLSIFCISDSSYRTMKSRAHKRLGIEHDDLETFLKKLE